MDNGCTCQNVSIIAVKVPECDLIKGQLVGRNVCNKPITTTTIYFAPPISKAAVTLALESGCG